jgi:hypothetical protein
MLRRVSIGLALLACFGPGAEAGRRVARGTRTNQVNLRLTLNRNIHEIRLRQHAELLVDLKKGDGTLLRTTDAYIGADRIQGRSEDLRTIPLGALRRKKARGIWPGEDRARDLDAYFDVGNEVQHGGFRILSLSLPRYRFRGHDVDLQFSAGAFPDGDAHRVAAGLSLVMATRMNALDTLQLLADGRIHPMFYGELYDQVSAKPWAGRWQSDFGNFIFKHERNWQGRDRYFISVLTAPLHIGSSQLILGEDFSIRAEVGAESSVPVTTGY